MGRHGRRRALSCTDAPSFGSHRAVLTPISWVWATQFFTAPMSSSCIAWVCIFSSAHCCASPWQQQEGFAVSHWLSFFSAFLRLGWFWFHCGITAASGATDTKSVCVAACPRSLLFSLRPHSVRFVRSLPGGWPVFWCHGDWPFSEESGSRTVMTQPVFINMGNTFQGPQGTHRHVSWQPEGTTGMRFPPHSESPKGRKIIS